jgi:NADPH:quinone reductase
MRAIQVQEFGGPEVLELRDVPVPEPGPDEVLVRVSRAGINFADTHQRENSYLAKFELPLIPGGEVAGTVDGRRVVAVVRSGGYAEYVVAPKAMTFPIPDGVEDGVALALIVQGTTAWHLYKTCAKLEPGERVLVISGAGGVGSLAVQLAKPFGAGHVVATASTAEKRQLCLELGADEAIAQDEISRHGPYDVVLEMAGGKVFDDALDALAPFGRLVTYGIAGREPNTVQSGALMRKSRSVVGFWLMHALDRMAEPLADLYDRAARGELRAIVGETYPMSEVRRAHEDLQGRRTSGKLLLDPRA